MDRLIDVAITTYALTLLIGLGLVLLIGVTVLLGVLWERRSARRREQAYLDRLAGRERKRHWMDDMEAEWERRRREAENDRRPPCPPTSP